MESRRAFKRLDIEEPVGIHAADNYRVEKARQFSEGGILFESDRDFRAGQHISLTFQLSDTVLVRLEAEVVHIVVDQPKRKLFGCKFLDPHHEHIGVVYDYFQKRGSA